jgi:hypothetical protein
MRFDAVLIDAMPPASPKTVARRATAPSGLTALQGAAHAAPIRNRS